jgi:hypothetical protein
MFSRNGDKQSVRSKSKGPSSVMVDFPFELMYVRCRSVKTNKKFLSLAYCVISLAVFSFDAGIASIVTANRIYHHQSGRKFQMLYGSRILDSQKGPNSLFTVNQPDLDQARILERTNEALELWLNMYKEDGFLVPGRDDDAIKEYKEQNRLDKDDNFILVYELLRPDFIRTRLIGFWGTSSAHAMERSLGISIHRRTVCPMRTSFKFLPIHWRVGVERFVNGYNVLVWHGGNSLAIGPVWADSSYPWVFSHMLHSAHWDAGITGTDHVLNPPEVGPSLVMPSDFVSWAAPRNDRNPRARLFRERLHHSPLLIDGSSSIVWRGKTLELSAIHITTYMNDLAEQLRHVEFQKFILRAKPGPLHVGSDPWLQLPTAKDWDRPGVIWTSIDPINPKEENPRGSCRRLLSLLSSSPVIYDLHLGPGSEQVRGEEMQINSDGNWGFVPLHGQTMKNGQ